MRKLYTAIHLVLILFLSRDIYGQSGQNQWKLTAIISEDSIASAKFLFTDPLHGYLFGFKLPPSYKNYILYRTVDGGLSWQKIDFHSVYGSDTLNYGGDYPSLSMFVGSPNSVMFDNEDPQYTGLHHDTLIFYWSENSGASWQRYQTQPVTSRNQYEVQAIPHDHEVIAMNLYNHDRVDAGKFGISLTNGVSFDETRWDSTLLKNLSQGGFGPDGVFQHVNNHQFDYFDDMTWIVTVPDSNNIDPLKPFSLVTLLSQDAGQSWKAYRNILPRFPYNMGGGTMQCLRGTSYVYLFSGFGPEGGIEFTGSYGYGFPAFGVNYNYSSDYGITWKEDTSFGINRRGYEAVAPGEVWCTITPHDSVNQMIPASWIVHTTNDGATWNIDSTSLSNDGYYDARIISFSGKNNGWIYAQRPDRKNIEIFKYVATDAVTNDNAISTGITYTIYPNPASNETSIQFTNNIKITNIELFDILGRKLICPYEISEGSLAHIHTAGLNSGSYIARTSTQNGNYIVSFFVQH